MARRSTAKVEVMVAKGGASHERKLMLGPGKKQKRSRFGAIIATSCIPLTSLEFLGGLTKHALAHVLAPRVGL